MQNESALGGGQVCSFVIGQGTTDQGRWDLSDLITVHEAQTMLRLHCDAVKEVELGYLQDVLDGPELRVGRAEYRRTNREGFVRHRATFVHATLLLARLNFTHL